MGEKNVLHEQHGSGGPPWVVHISTSHGISFVHINEYF
jgi:hypothetical protein